MFDVNAAFTGSLIGGGGSTFSEPDVFNLNPGGSISGSITGMSGNSTINYAGQANVTVIGTASAPANLGYQGTASNLTGGFSGINQINTTLGGTLKGDNNASTWTFAGLGGTTYSDTSASLLTFSGFHTLEGGSGSNTFDVQQNTSANLIGGTSTNNFVFTNNAILDGSIVGGAGTLDLSASSANLSAVLTSSNTTGLAGTVGPVTGGFTGINNLMAGLGTNTLTGEGDASTWSLNGSTTTYSDGHKTLTFSGFGTLYGGAGVNTFDVLGSNTANLNLIGGTGANDFVFSDTAVLTGSITGGADIDTLDLSAYGSSLTAVLNNTNATNGLAGTVGPVTGGFTGINNLMAGSGTNTLTGENTDHAASTTWNLSSTETYNDGTATLTFSGFGTLDGGSAANTFNILANFSSAGLNLNGGTGSNDFVFHNGGNLHGTINGQTATNSTIDYSAYTSAVTVNLGTGNSTGTNGISNIGFLDGGSNTTLVGPNTAIFWTINASTPGTLAATSGGTAIFTFNSVKNLSGGVLPNTFDLANGASITGAITGGSTNDTLDLSGSSGPATVNVTNNNAGSVRIGGFTVLNFSRIANVIGTAGSDNFVLSNGKGLTGSLNGGSGTDTLDYSAYTTSVRVNLSSTPEVATGIYGVISGIENVVGGKGNDILIGGSSTTSLTDYNGNDIIVGGGGPVTINGGTGNDIIITGDTTTDISHPLTVHGNGGTDLMIGGSYTQHSSDTVTLAALNSLMAEWDRTDVSLTTKISHLEGANHLGTPGGRNGSYDLYTGTVTLDSGAYTALYGGNGTTTTSSGNDWFIANSSTLVAETTSGDQTTRLLNA